MNALLFHSFRVSYECYCYGFHLLVADEPKNYTSIVCALNVQLCVIQTHNKVLLKKRERITAGVALRRRRRRRHTRIVRALVELLCRFYSAMSDLSYTTSQTNAEHVFGSKWKWRSARFIDRGGSVHDVKCKTVK